MFSDSPLWKKILLVLFVIWVLISGITLWGTGTDCSDPSNSALIECQPEEDNVTGWDPDGPGEPYDGGDFPAP
jgi:hypothetical protein